MSNDWIVVQPSLEPIIEKIEPILDPVISVIDALIAILNVTQKVLNIIKAFLIGILDPIRPIVEAIIAEIRTLISDLRQLGIYLHGDWELCTPSDYFSDLVGGYEVYERRMLQRLLDVSDPSRPNFSSNSAVIALFIYITSGDVALLIKLIQKLLAFFGQKTEGQPYAIPLTPEVLYSSKNFLGARIFVESDKLSERPTSISVTWKYPQGGGIPFLNSPAPKSYLIHVSTIPDGFGVIFTQPKDDVSKELENLAFITGAVIDPITNKGLRLYGGLDDLKFFENSASPQSPKMFLTIGPNTPLIDVALLKGSDPLFGCTFKVDTGFFNKLGAGQPITALIDVKDLPKHADIEASGNAAKLGTPYEADTYYIRVRACAEEKGGKLRKPERSSPFYEVTTSDIRTARMGAVVATVEDTKNYTDASSPVVAKVPSEKLLKYQKAVQCAIAVMILSRIDLDARTYPMLEKNKVEQDFLSGFEAVGRPLLQKYNIGNRLYNGTDPINFRKKVFFTAMNIQADLQKLCTPPDALLDAIEEDINTLLTKKLKPLSNMTVLEELASTSKVKGIGANPFCQGLSKKVLKKMYLKAYIGPQRAPSFYIVGQPDKTDASFDEWIIGNGSCDYAPILYPSGGALALGTAPMFLRNLFWEEKEIWAATGKILTIAGVTPNVKDKGWLSIRVMPQAFPQADTILDKLEDFLIGILESLKGIVDAIVAFIEAIQARIFQLQAILEYIKALLESLKYFSLPGMGGLLLVTQGTAGVAAGLIGSGNKPISVPTDYSAGVVLLSGGLPQILLDLLVAMLGGGGEEGGGDA